MSIVMTGIDHNHAALDIRSRFSLTASRQEQFYDQILREPDIDGCVLISTCNRMEIWLCLSNDTSFDPIAFLCDFAGVDQEQYRSFFIIRRDTEAIDHLFRLTAGLESRILGEDQILTQVGQAISFSRSLNAPGPVLEVLFRQAVTAGKRAKTEAVLSLADRSVIHTALTELHNRGFSVRGKKCMVIGNGMMGRLAMQILLENGAEVCVTVRKYHHKTLEVPEGCRKIEYADRYSVMPECDLIVSATTSPHYTLQYRPMKEAEWKRPLILLDLAVPRDIEPSIADLDSVSLYDIDSFQINLKTDQLKENLQKVEKILQEEKKSFSDWYERRDFAHQICAVRTAAGQDVLHRMNPCLRNISLGQREKEDLMREICGASERMMNHLLFALRNEIKEESFQEVIMTLRKVLLPPE